MVDATGPLKGIRVLELGSSVAGPFCGRLLADFGAEVIKVEIRSGDPVRNMSKRVDGHSLYAASIFRNKKLISINLREEKGRDLIKSLSKHSDVLIENFRPGTMERWGLDYGTLSKDNPGLIMVRISGFGQTGPYRERAGYGAIGDAISGLRHLTGDPDRPPARIAASVVDEITALYGAFGALMAVHEREQTGLGQEIDSALYEAAFSLIEPHIPAYSKLGIIPNRVGSRLPDSAPNNLYLSSDGDYIHITAMGDSVFNRLAKAIGQPELAQNEKFATQQARSANEEELDKLIQEWAGKLNTKELEEKLENDGVPAGRVYNVADIFKDPHFAARDMLVKMEDPELGELTLPGIVPKLSRTPGSIRHTGHSTVGQNTREVLTSILGLNESQINTLEKDETIYCGDKKTAAA